VIFHRVNARFLAAVLTLLLAAPALAQSARAPTDADLTVRLKEVEGNTKLAESLLKAGQKIAAVCANCHGEGGNSIKPDVPNLAGQNSAYLVSQLGQFAEGRRRNEFMEGMMKVLKADEKVAVVLFYSRQSVTAHGSSADAARLAKGKDIYGKNCFRCHAVDGHGNEVFARIAGQQTAYLDMTLKRYRTGSGARSNPLMAANTKLLTDADIEAVVTYVSSMQ